MYSALVQHSTAAMYSALLQHLTAAMYSALVQHSTAAMYSALVQHSTAAMYSALVQHSTAAMYSALVQHLTAAMYSALVQHLTAAMYSALVQHLTAALYSALVQHLTAAMFSALVLLKATCASYDATRMDNSFQLLAYLKATSLSEYSFAFNMISSDIKRAVSLCVSGLFCAFSKQMSINSTQNKGRNILSGAVPVSCVSQVDDFKECVELPTRIFQRCTYKMIKITNSIINTIN
uniref:Uncharacterized protein n=1 Tax=Timema tahoe TaxID=61484 RepID=A0A7R9IQE5_9NEOP|nr:unnamed protein product [Timema tahoe]